MLRQFPPLSAGGGEFRERKERERKRLIFSDFLTQGAFRDLGPVEKMKEKRATAPGVDFFPFWTLLPGRIWESVVVHVSLLSEQDEIADPLQKGDKNEEGKGGEICCSKSFFALSPSLFLVSAVQKCESGGGVGPHVSPLLTLFTLASPTAKKGRFRKIITCSSSAPRYPHPGQNKLCRPSSLAPTRALSQKKIEKGRGGGRGE